jgi:predicted nucleotidyltransferase
MSSDRLKKQITQKEAIKIAEKFLSFIKKEGFPIEKAYLYGSYAKGMSHFGSDIDVCLISKKFEKNKDDLEFWLWQKRREIHPLLEPIGFSPKEFTKLSPLVAEVQEKGIRIY